MSIVHVPIGVLVFLSVVVGPAVATELPLHPDPIAVVGAEDDTVLVAEPLFAVPLPDDHVLVFAKGTCEFHEFDPDWNRVRVFGRCGEGPGEYSRADAGYVIGDELWVFQQSRIMISDLDGTFRRTISLADHAVVEVLPLGDGWIGRDRGTSQRLLTLDDAGNLAGTPLDRGEVEDHLVAAGPVGAREGVVYYGSQSGEFFLCPPGAPARPIEPLSFGEAEVVREARGEGMVEYWTSKVSQAWTDPQGRLYVAAGEDRDPDDPTSIPVVRRYADDHRSYQRLELPEGFPYGTVYWGWNDQVIVLDRWGSRIFVFALRD